MDSPKHSGVISLFNLHFVSKGVVGKECGKIIAKAKDIREEGDYGDFIVVSEEEAELQIIDAQKILSEVKRVLGKLKG
ncbi:MAG: HEPN domain-containing protein [bacterium]